MSCSTRTGQYPSGTSSSLAKASMVASTPHIGPKSLVSCFWSAAPAFARSEEEIASISETSPRWLTSIFPPLGHRVVGEIDLERVDDGYRPVPPGLLGPRDGRVLTL